jgi:hypothetical protein
MLLGAYIPAELRVSMLRDSIEMDIKEMTLMSMGTELKLGNI